MTSVALRDFTGKTLTLSKNRAEQFLAELGRVRKHYPSGKGRPPIEAAPDCFIVVRNKKKRWHYELYGRTVLYGRQENKRWPFYFGLLLLEWLYQV